MACTLLCTTARSLPFDDEKGELAFARHRTRRFDLRGCSRRRRRGLSPPRGRHGRELIVLARCEQRGRSIAAGRDRIASKAIRSARSMASGSTSSRAASTRSAGTTRSRPHARVEKPVAASLRSAFTTTTRRARSARSPRRVAERAAGAERPRAAGPEGAPAVQRPLRRRRSSPLLWRRPRPCPRTACGARCSITAGRRPRTTSRSTVAS